MKYTRTLTLLLIFIFVSCESEKTKEDIIRKKIEERILPNMNDPKSYEFVSIAIIDSSTYLENIDAKIDQLKYTHTSPERIKDLEESASRFRNTSLNSYYVEELKEAKEELRKFDLLIIDIDSVKLTLGEDLDKTAVYLVEFTMRGKNSFGAIVLNTHYFTIGVAPDFEIYGYLEKLDEFSKYNFNSIPWIFDLLIKHR